ncbi:MAG: response regulator, partial [Dongiales bacterium]
NRSMGKVTADLRQRRTAGPRESHQRALVAVVDSAPLRLFRTVLEDLGFEIEAVDSGIGAVMAARERCPDLILVDMQLRDVPGREAVEWLRSNPALKSTPVIILAANSEDEADAASMLPGVLLRKPVSPVTVRRAIRGVLEKVP